MRALARVLCLAIGALSCNASLAGPRLVTDIRDIGPYLRRCWMPPAGRPEGVSVRLTLAFALRRDGSVIGEPRIVYLSPGLPDAMVDAYRLAAFKMLDNCTPAPLSPELGASIAGRQHRMHLTDTDRSNSQKDKELWRRIPKTPSSLRHHRDA